MSNQLLIVVQDFSQSSLERSNQNYVNTVTNVTMLKTSVNALRIKTVKQVFTLYLYK